MSHNEQPIKHITTKISFQIYSNYRVVRIPITTNTLPPTQARYHERKKCHVIKFVRSLPSSSPPVNAKTSGVWLSVVLTVISAFIYRNDAIHRLCQPGENLSAQPAWLTHDYRRWNVFISKRLGRADDDSADQFGEPFTRGSREKRKKARFLRFSIIHDLCCVGGPAHRRIKEY